MNHDSTNPRPASGVQAAAQKMREFFAGFSMPFLSILISFFLVELFAFPFLTDLNAAAVNWWPLAFGAIWAVLLTGIVRALPGIAGRIAYGVLYFLFAIYAAVQTGYYLMFGQMMWLSDFRYASEGSDYFSVLLEYPAGWWLGLIGLLLLGGVILWKFPRRKPDWQRPVLAGLIAAIAVFGALWLPEAVFLHDREIRYAGSDYGRAQSAEAAYDNMFNTHRLYQVCGVFQTGYKDFYANVIYPFTPGYAASQAAARDEINAYFDQRGETQKNALTGIFEGKNVVLVLMESMDDWLIGEHTPTIRRLMDEGIHFTNFYTPAYGGVRTFNSEFCTNTGSFLSSQGGYAFDYVTNCFDQSLAGQLTAQGYSALVYHYNTPSFYSRGVFSPAMGYEAYISYEDYITEDHKKDLYDDEFLFNYREVSDSFFRDGPKLNFIITRSAHLSYRYNEVVSHWGLKKYPQYRRLTGHEELNCIFLKARLVDDMFARLLTELEANGELENTVIVGVTDHYAYGFKDTNVLMQQSGVEDTLLLEKTPCFIWSPGGPDLEVSKTLNTADLLPTLLNLMGIDSPYRYVGQDAFDDRYTGYALFPNGSWISQGVGYNASTKTDLILESGASIPDELREKMAETVNQFVYINNLILETDYYRSFR